MLVNGKPSQPEFIELGGQTFSIERGFVTQIRLEDEEIGLKSLLSTEIDTDLVQTISEFTARQAAFQASLQLVGRTAELTVLNFI